MPFLATLLLLGVAAGGLAAGPARAEDSRHAQTRDGSASHYRLFVGDHAEGIVRAIDLRTGSNVGTFRIDRTPALTRSLSGRTVFAVQGDAGNVSVIDTGVTVEDHGDHADLKIQDARLLPTVITGTAPAHIVEGSGVVALFDDGTGEVALFRESELSQPSFAARRLRPTGAHHGLAAPMGSHLVVSVPSDAADKPRPGLMVVDEQGHQVGAMTSCPGVHGQAQSGGMFAFGCRDGIVLARPATGLKPPTLQHLPTAGLGDGYVSTLKGGSAMQFFLGNFGPNAVVIIEPDTPRPFRRIDLPARRVDFVLDPSKAERAYILTEDGKLHVLDILTGAIERSAQITGPYSMDGHWRAPRPRLAVAGDDVAVTDPLKGVVRLVSAATLEERRTIKVEGIPYTIVAVGGSGADH
ncbi:metallochaperone AztD [Azospirillum thermophilum]|uniref:metallochaperone AztD n=1 Tax=Azospirillum thermophilum TaxID=2202148 RepID=UPI0011B38F7E|nr:metallochaperone AztD [Azospirillum thermophilum]